MSTTIITFGPDQRPEKGAYALISGCDHEAARAIAFAVFGPEFCTSHDAGSDRGTRIMGDPERTLIGTVLVDIDPMNRPDVPTPITDMLFSGATVTFDETPGVGK